MGPFCPYDENSYKRSWVEALQGRCPSDSLNLVLEDICCKLVSTETKLKGLGCPSYVALLRFSYRQNVQKQKPRSQSLHPESCSALKRSTTGNQNQEPNCTDPRPWSSVPRVSLRHCDAETRFWTPRVFEGVAGLTAFRA